MKYLYKAVSVDEYVRGPGRIGGKDPRIGAFQALTGNETDFGINIAEILTHMLNDYGSQGWEYWQSAEFSPVAMKSIGANIMESTKAAGVSLLNNMLQNVPSGSIADPKNGRRYPIIIFRKVVSGEEFKKEGNVAAQEKPFDDEKFLPKHTHVNTSKPAQHEFVSQKVDSHTSFDKSISLEIPENNQLEMQSYGITFEGENYVYKTNKFDFLKDAIAFAKLERVHLEADLEMQSYGITFEGENYVYKTYKYKYLKDAIAFAKLERVHLEADFH